MAQTTESVKLPIQTFMTKIKPVVRANYEIEYRHKTILIALLEILNYHDQKRRIRTNSSSIESFPISVKSAIETLLEEIEGVVKKTHELEYRDETKRKAFLQLSNHQKSDASNQIDNFSTN